MCWQSMINHDVDMISSTPKHEILNGIKNVVGFVENFTVGEKTFDFYRLM